MTYTQRTRKALAAVLGSSLCFQSPLVVAAFTNMNGAVLGDTYSLDRITSEELAVLGTTGDQPSSSRTGVLVLEF